MISQKLKNIFLVSIPIFIAHGLEEYFNDFYDVDSISKFAFRPFETMAVSQATFLLFQVLFWLFLIISFLLVTSEKWRLRFMVIPGLIYIFELHHLWRALASWNYYPGLVTALVFPVIAFLFWKELWRDFSKH